MLKHFSLSFENSTFTLRNFAMKIFTYTLIVIALALIIFNLTLLDFNNLFEGDSVVALIGIAAAFCAIFILIIFRMSKMIEEKLEDR